MIKTAHRVPNVKKLIIKVHRKLIIFAFNNSHSSDPLILLIIFLTSQNMESQQNDQRALDLNKCSVISDQVNKETSSESVDEEETESSIFSLKKIEFCKENFCIRYAMPGEKICWNCYKKPFETIKKNIQKKCKKINKMNEYLTEFSNHLKRATEFNQKELDEFERKRILLEKRLRTFDEEFPKNKKIKTTQDLST
jgi:hypothetical protein